MAQDVKNTIPKREREKIKTITLEKSLEAYRAIAAPSELSWKKKSMTATYESPDLMSCHISEQNSFIKRNLAPYKITIYPRVQMKSEVPIPETIFTLEDIYKKLIDPSRASIDKTKREVIYPTDSGIRPTGERAFMLWNGFQVIDLDIKNRKIALIIKEQIFKSLCKCNWFLGVTFSSSGKGLHVYTKITVPEEFYESPLKMRMLFLTNFRHKFSFVYISCLNVLGEIGKTKDDLKSWMDLAMFKPAQAAFIGYDPHPLINTNYFEDYIYICFDNVDDMGHPEIDWVTYPDLKEIFARFEWFIGNEDDTPTVNRLSDKDDEAPDESFGEKVHYKHNERWRLANTLVALYEYDLAVKYLRRIVSNKVPDKELVADCRTADHHKKPIDVWAVNRLNSNHNFKIKIKVEGAHVGEEQLYTAMERVGNPNNIIESQHKYTFNINKDQYLGDIIDDLLGRFGQRTLIEAGPGLGKTEMVKQLARMDKKIMLVLPFTSIIKSKVESEDGWTYSYGSRKPKLGENIALTIDKFSRLNMMDIKTAGYDYIFIDESHLMFMSEYRSIMPKVIDMISNNTDIRVVLMTGTPTGEIVFFPDIVHIHVIKEETRQKVLQLNLVDDNSTLMYVMCRAMAKDIAEGKRILYPTNEGTLHSKRIEAGINYFLENEHQILDKVNLRYYKKSNLGDEFMDSVNLHKTVKDVQVVMCTTYMGCGVDINDKLQFQIYFGDLCTAAECDQWCNRLRNNNLFVKMYIAKNDADGNPRGIDKFRPMNFKYSDDEVMNIHSLVQICNSMIARNPTEYKYNSIVSSIIHNNQFICYDEINCKYYLNLTALKTVMFERKYRDYAEQVPVFMKGMECYGYQVDPKDIGQFNLEGSLIFRDLKNLVKMAADEQMALNTIYVEELLDLMNDQRLGMYKEVLSGSWEIRKGDEWKDDPVERIMTVKSIEVFEKVAPIVISLNKRYNIPEIHDIFEYCKTNRRGYNFSAIGRIRALVNIVEAEENHRLDMPIKQFMEETWTFADIGKTTKVDLDIYINDWTTKYTESESYRDIKIDKSVFTVKYVKKQFEKIFKCLVKYSRPDKKGNITMERQELVWPKREHMMDSKSDKIVLPDDFMHAWVKTTDININGSQSSDPIDIDPEDDQPPF